MLVCAEYVSRKGLTIGKNSTLMPFFPLLPHILSLIFCAKVEYVSNSAQDRYHSLRFVNYETLLRFDYSFTSEDAKAINKIRNDINYCLGNNEFIENIEKICAIKDDIFALLLKPREPILDELPDWKEILN